MKGWFLWASFSCERYRLVTFGVGRERGKIVRGMPQRTCYDCTPRLEARRTTECNFHLILTRSPPLLPQTLACTNGRTARI